MKRFFSFFLRAWLIDIRLHFPFVAILFRSKQYRSYRVQLSWLQFIPTWILCCWLQSNQ